MNYPQNASIQFSRIQKTCVRCKRDKGQNRRHQDRGRKGKLGRTFLSGEISKGKKDNNTTITMLRKIIMGVETMLIIAYHVQGTVSES